MSLTLGPYGQKIARIQMPQNEKLNQKTVYIYDEFKQYVCCPNCALDETKKCCQFCKIETDENQNKKCVGGGKININLPYPNNHIFKLFSKNKKSKFVPLPNTATNEPDHILIVGQTGAGKSSFIADYLEEIDQNKTVFVFTASTKPEPFDKFKPIRIDVKMLINMPVKNG